ncbi:hypothetical protein BC938DRAFT_475000 [Jimgerdemannia flammicorona]|uniref:Uncharacterized protein n=1 Tax=Jimgerdemannia flammicorona TaxID=994334 RepID=A0A433QS22_9FUNG|nr:hypothetical protein BC938DRAFT_475000 [Jimgerdemannia flammicorona]
MWKSWVGRLKTQQDDEDLAGIQSMHEASEPSSPVMSVEAIARRQQEQAALKQLFKQSIDPLRDEKERTQIFLVQVLPKFCDLYGNTLVLSAKEVSESVADFRALTIMVTKQFIYGIRKVPETQNKAQASKEIMRMLRSKSQMYYTLRMIDMICRGPKVPSVLVKLFRSFIDLPPSEYDPAIPQLVDVSVPDENAPPPEELVSVKEVGDVVAGILKKFVQKQLILRRLVVEDTFFMIIRIMLARPTSVEGEGEKEGELRYLVWKQRTYEVLTALEMDAEVVNYLHSKNAMNILVQPWKEALGRAPLNKRDYQEALLTAQLVLHLLKGSARDSLYALFYDFKEANGYESLSYLLTSQPFDEDAIKVKEELLALVEELVYYGKDDPKPVASEGTPYQHDDTTVRNLDAFQCLMASFLYPTSSVYPPPPGFSLYNVKQTPLAFRTRILATVEAVIQKHPINYFLIERVNSVPMLIEKLDSYDAEIQKQVMILLVYVMTTLNYVPFRELAVLSLHFQGTSSGHTTALVCETITVLLRRSPKFKDVFREVGLLNVFSTLLCELAETLQDGVGNVQFVRRISVSNLDRAKMEKKRFAQEVLKNYDIIIECLVELMTGSRMNANMFRKSYRGNLFDLMHYDETRYGALNLFETLVIEGSSLNGLPRTSTSSISPSRNSSVSNRSSSPVESGFQFGRLIEIVQSLSRQDLTMKIQILRSMKRIFVACPELKDVFRHTGGYVCLVSMLVGLEGVYESIVAEEKQRRNSQSTEKERKEEVEAEEKEKVEMEKGKEAEKAKMAELEDELSKDQTIELLRAVFSVLAESMSNHEFNRRFFTDHIGFQSVEDALRLTDVLGVHGSREYIFGILFGFAIGNDGIYDLFVEGPEDATQEPKSEKAPVIVTNGARSTAASKVIKRIEVVLKDPSVILHNPQAVLAILKLQDVVRHDHNLSLNIYTALLSIAWANRRNQVYLNQNGVLMAILERLYPKRLTEIGYEVDGTEADRPNAAELEVLNKISKRIMMMGVSSCELRYLFECFQGDHAELAPIDDRKATTLMDMLLYGISHSRWPNFVQFDMGPYGHSSLEMTTFGARPFPPSNNGYTFMTWFQVERFDENHNLGLLGVHDEEKKCQLSVFIDAQTRRLNVQTNPKYPAKFDAFEFQSGYWYHLALVHHKSRLSITASTISMYVNGSFVEQVRCAYLSQPAPNNRVKAFLGTPPEPEAMASTQPSNNLAWDLGPCYLMEDVVDPDVINLLFNLGARYRSLFQDSLRQFQTYETSTILYMSLRAITKGFDKSQDDHTTFVNAMRGTGGASLPEEKILFAFFAGSTLTEGTNSGIAATGLSDSALHMLGLAALHGKMILNAAVPKIEAALSAPEGTATLMGDPVVAYPSGLDDSIWKIGGCAVALKLVERAEVGAVGCWLDDGGVCVTPLSLHKAVAILFELVRYSWRNSEDMERNHGYELLAYLLKQKRNMITIDLLNLMLVFIGKDPEFPEESVINNPFAYRYLLMNFDIWKRTDIEVQRAHLEQFLVFIQLSKKKAFNVKRLLKMHLVKKMLLALRVNVPPKELIPSFIAALRAATLANWSVETIRAIATFLASTMAKPSAYRKHESSHSRPPLFRKRSSTAIPLQTEDSAPEAKPNAADVVPVIVTDAKTTQTENAPKHVVLCNMVMEMLHDILCDKANSSLVSKFANTITNKWPLLFFSEDSNPYAVVLASRILAHLIASQGSMYISKFRVASEGFMVMRRLLPRYWYLTQLYGTLLAIMLGVDIVNIPLDANFDLFTLLTIYKKENNKKENTSQQGLILPEIMPIILALVKEAINVVVQQSEISKKLGGGGGGGVTNGPPAPRESLSSVVSVPVTDIDEQKKQRRRSKSMGDVDTPEEVRKLSAENIVVENIKQRIAKIAHVEQTLIHFFSDMYTHSSDFKDICCKPELGDSCNYIRRARKLG